MGQVDIEDDMQILALNLLFFSDLSPVLWSRSHSISISRSTASVDLSEPSEERVKFENIGRQRKHLPMRSSPGQKSLKMARRCLQKVLEKCNISCTG